MVVMADLKAELLRLIDELDSEQLTVLLDEARWLLEEPSEDEMADILEGFAQIDRGESVSLDDLLKTSGS